jgi:hypothetical protein
MTLSPAQIASKLGVNEFTKLCEKVEDRYKQGFKIVSVTRSSNQIDVEVSLDDQTNHMVVL